MATSVYAELHAWSNFSFLEGGSHPEELVRTGRGLGLAALALTDRDGLYGAVRFAKAADEVGLPAICGAELTLETPDAAPIRAGRPARATKDVPTDGPRLVLLAEDKRGYANLTRLISTAQLRGRKRDARLQLEDLDGHTDGLIALSGGYHGPIERALRQRDDAGARALSAHLRDVFAG
ncbi:MAG: PHP domain-containing protein, partial [Vulcanimicrobiaceae bacterium]